LILGVVLPAFSGSLQAQTAEERARLEDLRQREQEIRERMELRLREVREERLVRIEEALARAREESAQAGLQLREMNAARLEQLERALAEAKAHLELTEVEEEEALARAMETQVRALDQMDERRRHFNEARARQLEAQADARAEQADARNRQEALVAQYRVRAEEARERARDQERQVRQMVVRVRARVRLGVSLDGNQGEELDRQGVKIQGVMEDTPAEEAGLREGDLITHLNGQSLLSPIPGEADEGFDEDGSLPVQRLISLAGDLEAGDEVEIRYLRDGAADTVTFEAAEIDEPSVMVYRGDTGEAGVRRILRVDPEGEGVWSLRLPDDELLELKLSELKSLEDLEDLRIDLRDLHVDLEALEDLELRAKDLNLDTPRIRITSSPEGLVRGYALRGGESPLAYNIIGRGNAYGLQLTEINPGLAEYFSSEVGLLVLEVEEGSTLGLSPGDVILAIGGREVEEQGDVRRILRSYEKEETVSFTVVRKGREMTVEGTIR
jgi:C-terminal processing protease CtpA/Prc